MKDLAGLESRSIELTMFWQEFACRYDVTEDMGWSAHGSTWLTILGDGRKIFARGGAGVRPLSLTDGES